MSDREVNIFDMNAMGKADSQLLFDRLLKPQIDSFRADVPEPVLTAAIEAFKKLTLAAAKRSMDAGVSARLAKAYLRGAYRELKRLLKESHPSDDVAALHGGHRDGG